MGDAVARQRSSNEETETQSYGDVQGQGGTVFLTPAEKRESQGPSVKDMQAKIGQLALENDFLAGALGRIDGASAKK